MFSFSKMQATGNDFIVINYLENKLEYSYRLLAKFLCDRHFGVGADGVLIVEESKVSDFKMRIFNQDGTEAEMCGNGIRCFAKYIYDKYHNSAENTDTKLLTEFIAYAVAAHHGLFDKIDIEKLDIFSSKLQNVEDYQEAYQKEKEDYLEN